MLWNIGIESITQSLFPNDVCRKFCVAALVADKYFVLRLFIICFLSAERGAPVKWQWSVDWCGIYWCKIIAYPILVPLVSLSRAKLLLPWLLSLPLLVYVALLKLPQYELFLKKRQGDTDQKICQGKGLRLNRHELTELLWITILSLQRQMRYLYF